MGCYWLSITVLLGVFVKPNRLAQSAASMNAGCVCSHNAPLISCVLIALLIVCLIDLVTH